MNSLAPETFDIPALPSLPLAERFFLPNVSAIYFVLGSDHEVLYIGQTKSLCFRWQHHHIQKQITTLPYVHIAYLVVTEIALLRSIETACIRYFKPPYNKPRRVVSATWRLQIYLSDPVRDAIKDIARQRDIGFHKLVQAWLLERLEMERQAAENQPRHRYKKPVGA